MLSSSSRNIVVVVVVVVFFSPFYSCSITRPKHQLVYYSLRLFIPFPWEGDHPCTVSRVLHALLSVRAEFWRTVASCGRTSAGQPRPTVNWGTVSHCAVQTTQTRRLRSPRQRYTHYVQLDLAGVQRSRSPQ